MLRRDSGAKDWKALQDSLESEREVAGAILDKVLKDKSDG